MLIKGLCCACCYKNKSLEKFKKKPADQLNPQNSNRKDGANYNSMNNDGKDGKKYQSSGQAQPSMLNFDITGDVTADNITDNEAGKQGTVTPIKKNPTVHKQTQKLQNSTPQRNNRAVFTDQNLQETTVRDKISLTQGKDDNDKFKKVNPQIVEDHVRTSSNLTHPQGSKANTLGGKPIQEEAESLHSYQFSGSAFKAPSDAAAENQQAQQNIKNGGQNAAGEAGSQNEEEWMYEDTIQEEFDD